MRGYFGIGVEGVNKPMNVGAVVRTAHAFGASFAFTLGATYARDEANLADTSDAAGNLPFYEFASIADFALPRDCELVGIELMAEAIELPSFRHPRAAAYILGPERGSLSPDVVVRCVHIVKIPTRFSINLALAGALVMYDRLISMGRFPERPVASGGPVIPLERHDFAPPRIRRGRREDR
ncbi:MAG: RNA methyltransferase [Alphaproteobacteria bacterium]|nr:RNA methyltransferase [Alphaproteobacteria bacterium]